jgi:hypothetical protein
MLQHYSQVNHVAVNHVAVNHAVNHVAVKHVPVKHVAAVSTAFALKTQVLFTIACVKTYRKKKMF